MATKSGSMNTTNSKICSACGEEKKLPRGFYVSYNPLHKDGYVPICKDCMISYCYNKETNEISFNGLLSLLRQFNKPFIIQAWNAAVNEFINTYSENPPSRVSKRSIIGNYLKNIHTMKQYRVLDWDTGEEYNVAHPAELIKTSLIAISDQDVELLEKKSDDNMNIVKDVRRKGASYNEKVYYLTGDDFEVTEDIIRLFGEGYTEKEYQEMKRLYEKCKLKYPNMSDENDELILQYVRYATKAKIAVSMDNIADAEKWSKLATEALKQLNSIDVQGGVTCFSEFFQKFERVKDVTRILPRFKYRPNDAPDFIIWCYINYCRRLEGKPEVSYGDVYKFYDDKVAEYVKQYGDPYGIFSDDPRLNNREKIKEFIELPPDYYGDNDEIES